MKVKPLNSCNISSVCLPAAEKSFGENYHVLYNAGGGVGVAAKMHISNVLRQDCLHKNQLPDIS